MQIYSQYRNDLKNMKYFHTFFVVLLFLAYMFVGFYARSNYRFAA